MIMDNKEKNSERIQHYLEGQLSAEAHKAFEAELSTNPELKEELEKFNLLKEGIQLAALQEERARLKSIHEAIMTENTREADNIIEAKDRFQFRRMLSIASLLLLGVLIGGGLQQMLFDDNSKPAIVDDDNYGNQTDGLPVLEEMVTLIKGEIIDGKYEEQISDLLLAIFECNPCKQEYTLSNNQLALFTGKMEDLNVQESPTIFLIKKGEDSTKIAFLKSNQLSTQIPLSDEDFDTIWNE